MIGAEYKTEIESTKDTPYLTLTGKLWCDFCDNFEENWPCYNNTALYWQTLTDSHDLLAHILNRVPFKYKDYLFGHKDFRYKYNTTTQAELEAH